MKIPSFPRRRESRNITVEMDSRFRGNDKINYLAASLKVVGVNPRFATGGKQSGLRPTIL